MCALRGVAKPALSPQQGTSPFLDMKKYRLAYYRELLALTPYVDYVYKFEHEKEESRKNPTGAHCFLPVVMCVCRFAHVRRLQARRRRSNRWASGCGPHLSVRAV